MSRRYPRVAARFADFLLLPLRGPGPTLMVLGVLVVSGVPPYARILNDLQGLLSLLMQ